jgi:hypothetical protein
MPQSVAARFHAVRNLGIFPAVWVASQDYDHYTEILPGWLEPARLIAHYITKEEPK